MDIDKAKEALASSVRHKIDQYRSDSLSEADTRCKLVDVMLDQVLGWRETHIRRECRVIDLGRYIDYMLLTNRPAFVIEAKKNGAQFSLPSVRNRRRFKIGGVLAEDKELSAAIIQARDYAVSKGISPCCVTNGTQYIFFRSQNDQGVDFLDHYATVFSSIDDILSDFLAFYSVLSWELVSIGAHISSIPAFDVDDSETRRLKKVASLPLKEQFRNRNKFFPLVREIVQNVFQDLSSDNASEELIEQCYVESVRDSSYEQSLRSLMQEKPGLAERATKPLRVDKKGAGKFQELVESGSSYGVAEVVLLLGGIGVGKTTFVHRFRKVIAKNRIDSGFIWIYVSFNKYSESPEPLANWVSDQIFRIVEDEYPELEFGSYSALKQAYHAEYERLKRGRLAPVFQASPESFELEFSKELATLGMDAISHVIKLLKEVGRRSDRRIFLVFDNADQFNSSLQNDVFMLAHRMAQDVGCSLIISLREESYWKNKNFGSLSAFHSANFHVDAPKLQQVISKRFRYAEKLLEEKVDAYLSITNLNVSRQEAIEVFDRLKHTVINGDSRIVEFLEKLSPREIRRPLEQLARFLYSGHTHIDSLLRAVRQKENITIGFHEFVKSVALGDRERFDETKSDVINLFALDGAVDASNVNRLVVLGRIIRFRSVKTEAGVGYVRIDQIIDDLSSVGIAEDTTRGILDFLNSRRVLETENQFRDESTTSLFIRSTHAALYYLEVLGKQFSYLDLMVPGLVMADGSSFDIVERLTMQINTFGKKAADRISALECRVERAKCFARYISGEFMGGSWTGDREFLDKLVYDFVEDLENDIAKQESYIIGGARKAFGY